MRTTPLAPLCALCALAPLSSACDPLGFWSTDAIGDDRPPPVAELVVASGAAGLDGLVDFARADGARCGADDDGCVHLGAVREALVPRRSCDGLSFADDLALFTWTCVDAGDEVRARGVLRDDKGLADLVDLTGAGGGALRENVLEVRAGGDVVGRSLPSVWWSTAVRAASTADGGVLDEEDTLWIAGDDDGPLTLAGARQALLVRPGEALVGLGADEALSTSGAPAFVWLEGALRADTAAAVELRDVRWLLVRRADIRGPVGGGAAGEGDGAGEGLFVGGRNLHIVDTTFEDAGLGLRVSPATHLRLERVRVSHTRDGVLLSDVVDLVAHDVVVEAASSSALYIDGGARQQWRGLVLAGQSYGVSGGNATDVTFSDVTSFGTDVAVIDVHTMTRMEVSGLLSVNDLIAVRINDGDAPGDSSALRFSDFAVIGAGAGASTGLASRVFSFDEVRPAGMVFAGRLLLGDGADCEFEGDGCAGTPFDVIERGAPATGGAPGLDAGALVGRIDDDASDASDATSPTRVLARPNALAGGEGSRGACTAAGPSACVRVDVALRAGSPLVGALPLESLRAGGAAGVAESATPFLERARELAAPLLAMPGAGDGDGRCEPGETCAPAANIGAYQGHGGLRAPRAVTVEGASFLLAEPARNGF